jgi:hypothetical protein
VNTTTKKLLTRYQYLWERQPLFLINLPNIPDPRRQPERAKLAARSMLQVSSAPQLDVFGYPMHSWNPHANEKEIAA